MLAAEGARVVLAARRGEELERVAAGICRAGGVAMPIVTDLADDDSMAHLVVRTAAELGPVDVLVNNVGFGRWKPLEETSIAEWDHTFAVNVRAAAYLSAAVVPSMQARRFGRVINIGSEAGAASVPGLAAYCVSKHALRALTEVIQDANHDNGIKAWIICPGFVDTDMGEVVPGANLQRHAGSSIGTFRKGSAAAIQPGHTLSVFAHSSPSPAPSPAGQATRRHPREDHTSCPATVSAISRWCGPLSGA